MKEPLCLKTSFAHPAVPCRGEKPNDYSHIETALPQHAMVDSGLTFDR